MHSKAAISKTLSQLFLEATREASELIRDQSVLSADLRAKLQALSIQYHNLTKDNTYDDSALPSRTLDQDELVHLLN